MSKLLNRIKRRRLNSLSAKALSMKLDELGISWDEVNSFNNFQVRYNSKNSPHQLPKNAPNITNFPKILGAYDLLARECLRSIKYIEKTERYILCQNLKKTAMIQGTPKFMDLEKKSMLQWGMLIPTMRVTESPGHCYTRY